MFVNSNFFLSNKTLKIARSFFFFMPFILVFYFISCTDRNEEKKVKTEIKFDSLIYDKDGNLFTGRMKGKVYNKNIEYDVVKGKKNGEYRLYHENGKLEIEGQIENNKNTGLWKYYYSNGKVESKGHFKNDLAEGEWTWYYPSGRLKETAEFKNGERDGIAVIYNENGEVIEKRISEGKEISE